MEVNENIISWYPFKINDKVLLISLKKEQRLNQFFEKKGLKITNYEIRNNRDYNKLEISEFKDKYDYILLLGSYEYTPLFFKCSNPYCHVLKALKFLLNENGKIIFSVDNKFGVKYFSGYKSEHYSKIFGSLLNSMDYNKSNLLSKHELIDVISKAGFKNYKFYYPLPNYSNANAIFTDEFLPDESTSKLLYKLCYNQDSVVLYNEIELMKQFCKDELFSLFCNSYLIELSLKANLNDTRFVSYNDLRKDKYNLRLVIDNDVAIKTPVTDFANIHIENVKKYIFKLKELGFNILDYVENNSIKSKFVKNKQLDKVLVELIYSGQIKEAYNTIIDWYNYIKERLSQKTLDPLENNIFKEFDVEIKEEYLSQMNFIEDGFIDLAFENTFLNDDKKYIFYDQEWFFANIPIEFILYRALNNLYCYNNSKLQNVIELDDILKRFDLLKWKEYFQEIELIIQNSIINKQKLEKNKELQYQVVYSLENLVNTNRELTEDNNAWSQKYEELEKKYLDLENNFQILEKKHLAIVNSKAYKLYRHIRGENND